MTNKPKKRYWSDLIAIVTDDEQYALQDNEERSHPFFEIVLKSDYKELEEKLEIAKEALMAIDKWWDTSDLENIVPAVDPGSKVRNDSVAGYSIVLAKEALEKYKAWESKK